MAKETSLSSQIARIHAEKSTADAQEERATLKNTPPEGKVWVRLIRPHYDANGVLHREGVAALSPDAIPKSAVRLSAGE